MKHIHLQSLTLFSLLLLSLLPALAQRRLPATEENKRKADYVLLEATRKQMSGKTADAYLLLDYAHRLDPMNTKVNFNRSLMRLQFTEIDSVSIDEIVRDLRYAAQNDPANKIDNMNIANIFFNLRLLQPSADIITKLLTYYPKELEYYETLSNIYQNAGDIDKAISMMDSIERKSKATEYTCLKRSLLYSIKGDTTNAISVVRQQYEKAPEVLSNNIMLGIAFSNNGSTGGTDIIAAVIHKYRDVTLGQVMRIMDLIIITSSYLVLHDWEKVVYGYVTLFISSFVLDQVVNGARQSVQFFIISDKYEEIGRHINQFPHRGVTVINASGFYTGREVRMLFVLAKKSESTIIFRLIKDIDPKAFVSQSAVIGVYGEGFDKIKVK